MILGKGTLEIDGRFEELPTVGKRFMITVKGRQTRATITGVRDNPDPTLKTMGRVQILTTHLVDFTLP